MDFGSIMADREVGTAIGRLYMAADPEVTPLARRAYGEFAAQVDLQFAELSRQVRVIFQTEDPYADHEEMFADVSRGTLRVYRTAPDQAHPVLSNRQNNRFRAVHDFFGHYHTGRGFDRHGEEAAWAFHSLMFHGLARRAMTTETRGQSSAFIWVNGGREFPAQKAVLLPRWVSELR